MHYIAVEIFSLEIIVIVRCRSVHKAAPGTHHRGRVQVFGFL